MPSGIVHVLVNGRFAMRDGARTEVDNGSCAAPVKQRGPAGEPMTYSQVTQRRIVDEPYEE